MQLDSQSRTKPLGDRIILRGLQFSGLHGVNEEEKKVEQAFVVNVDAWLSMDRAGGTDNLMDTVSYTDLYRTIKQVVEGPHFDLLEALAHAIANRILNQFYLIRDVRVRIGKPKVAAKIHAEYIGVEIFRTAPM